MASTTTPAPTTWIVFMRNLTTHRTIRVRITATTPVEAARAAQQRKGLGFIYDGATPA